MSQLRLLQRINSIAVHGHTDVTPSFVQLFQSVREHLNKLMNTRIGSVLTDINYGKPHYIMGRNDDIAVRQYIQDVIKMLEKYEPRLHAPTVSDFAEVNILQELRYTIHGSIMSDNRISEVDFRVIIDDRDKVVVM